MAHALKNTSLRLATAPEQPPQKPQFSGQSAPVHLTDQESLQRSDASPQAGLPEALFRAERVSLQYQTGNAIVQATRDVSFSIYEGDRFIVLGPSGCGKSSLLKAAAGFIKPQSGAFTLNGKAISGPGPDRVVVFQEFDQLAPWKTVLQNVIFALRASRTLDKVQARERAEHYLNRVGLGSFLHAYPHTLSGGMKQRVAIARALAMEPAVLLMDEPFAAVDAMTRQRLQEELAVITTTERTTVLFVTHAIEEAVFLSDRVVALSGRPGRIVADVEIDLPRPRQWANLIRDPRFQHYRDTLTASIERPEAEAEAHP